MAGSGDAGGAGGRQAGRIMETATPMDHLMARVYDGTLALGERRGMRDRRAALLAQADGQVLEIGAGTGLNVPHYPAAAELTLTEPIAPMRARLEQRLSAAGRRAAVVDARAEALPFADDSFDVVVSTLVLCTVDDPDDALREIRRVLRPAGRFLFIEHVRAVGGARGWMQDRLAGPWAAFAGGCRCNRGTSAMIDRHLPHTAQRAETWHGMPGLVRPLTVGAATG
jgi:ubiquinone/menaquinone biosynthesis C-methylase UbiE